MYSLHGVDIDFHTSDERIAARWRRQWAPFAKNLPATSGAPISVRLDMTTAAPPPPALPLVSQGPTVAYFRDGPHLTASFQRWGSYDIDLEAGTVAGVMTERCLRTYGIFEDMIIIALAPLLRRRGFYTIHAFAAAITSDDLQPRAAVLVGDMGAGKTTTGISLLRVGARLIANDSPLLRLGPDGALSLCAYPGLLSAYPDSLSWFPELTPVLAAAERLDQSAKLCFAVDDVWTDAWQQMAPPGALFFPQFEPSGTTSALSPLPKFQALQRLVGQSIESWDIVTIPDHLHALRTLVDAVPSYTLHLTPDIDRIPRLIADAMSHQPL